MDISRYAQRRMDIELLRLLAALFIVSFHGGGLLPRDIAYSGLVVFLFLTAYYATVSQRKSVADMAFRLLVPYGLWFIIYIGVFAVVGRTIFQDHHSIVRFLLASPSIHLWFLPFLFLITVVIQFAAVRAPARAMAWVVALLAILLVVTSPQWRKYDIESPFAQWLHALAPVCVGVLAGLLNKLNERLRWALSLAVAASLAYVGIVVETQVVFAYALGIVGCGLLMLPGSVIPSSAILARLATTTLGIYLIHPAVLVVLYKFGVRDAALVLAGFAVSMVAVLIGQQVLPSRWRKYLL